MDWLSDGERERIAELLAEGAPFWRLRQEVPRSRHSIRRAVRRLRQLPKVEPVRSRLHLSLAEREEISRGIAVGESLRCVAARLSRSPSSVAREVTRHGGRDRYRASVADRAAVANMARPKVAKLARCSRLRAVVEHKLELRWSPQQIAGWLSEEFPDDPEMRVSHETIYLSLFVQTRGALRKELTRYLRMRHSARRPGGKPERNGQSHIPAMVNIRERPAEADDRAVPGHWEGDLIYGRGRGVVATLVERHSRFVMLVGLPDKHSGTWSQQHSQPKSSSYPSSFADHSPGTRAGRWLTIKRSPSPAGCPCTSATPAAHGNAAPTKTPTDCCANTSHAPAHSATAPKSNSTTSPPNSTVALDKPSDGRHHHKHSITRCTDPLRPAALMRFDGCPLRVSRRSEADKPTLAAHGRTATGLAVAWCPRTALLGRGVTARSLRPLVVTTGSPYLSYQPSRKARPRVQSRRLNINQAGVAPLSISILSVSRARTAKM